LPDLLALEETKQTSLDETEYFADASAVRAGELLVLDATTIIIIC